MENRRGLALCATRRRSRHQRQWSRRPRHRPGHRRRRRRALPLASGEASDRGSAHGYPRVVGRRCVLTRSRPCRRRGLTTARTFGQAQRPTRQLYVTIVDHPFVRPQWCERRATIGASRWIGEHAIGQTSTPRSRTGPRQCFQTGQQQRRATLSRDRRSGTAARLTGRRGDTPPRAVRRTPRDLSSGPGQGWRKWDA